MPGPGMEYIGEEEKKEVLEVIESGYLFRYGVPENKKFKAKVWTYEKSKRSLNKQYPPLDDMEDFILPRR